MRYVVAKIRAWNVYDGRDGRRNQLNAEKSHAVEEIGITQAENENEKVDPHTNGQVEWDCCGIADPYVVNDSGNGRHDTYKNEHKEEDYPHSALRLLYPFKVMTLVSIGCGGPIWRTDD